MARLWWYLDLSSPHETKKKKKKKKKRKKKKKNIVKVGLHLTKLSGSAHDANNKGTDQLSFDEVGLAPFMIFVGMKMQPTHEVGYFVLRTCV